VPINKCVRVAATGGWCSVQYYASVCVVLCLRGWSQLISDLTGKLFLSRALSTALCAPTRLSWTCSQPAYVCVAIGSSPAPLDLCHENLRVQLHINRSRNNAGKPRTTGGSLTIRTQALLQLSNALHVVLYIHEAKASIRYTHTHLHEIVPSLWNTICQCTILILDWSYRKFEKYFDTGQTAAPLPV